MLDASLRRIKIWKSCSEDAELFLILPRLVLLSSLWEHSYSSLPRSFVEEQMLVEFEELKGMLADLNLRYPGDQLAFWKLLVSKLIEGPGDSADVHLEKLPGCLLLISPKHNQQT